MKYVVLILIAVLALFVMPVTAQQGPLEGGFEMAMPYTVDAIDQTVVSTAWVAPEHELLYLTEQRLFEQPMPYVPRETTNEAIGDDRRLCDKWGIVYRYTCFDAQILI